MGRNRKDVIRNLVTIILLRASKDGYKRVEFQYQKGEKFFMRLIEPDGKAGKCEQLQIEDFAHIRAAIEEFVGDSLRSWPPQGDAWRTTGKIVNMGDGVIVDWPVIIKAMTNDVRVEITVSLIGERDVEA